MISDNCRYSMRLRFTLKTSLNPDRHAVIGRLDIRRQAALELGIIEVRMQVGENRPPRPDPLDPGERLLDAEMARMRPVAQGVDDPEIETGERGDARLGQ